MITESEIVSVTAVIRRMSVARTDIDTRDVVQEAALKILECGMDLCVQTLYGFGVHAMYHALARRKVRIRYATERRSWIPSPDYGYETPKSDMDLGWLAPEEREIMEKLLAQADRNGYGQKGRKRKYWPRFVTECLATARQTDSRRKTARKTSTIQPKDRQ